MSVRWIGCLSATCFLIGRIFPMSISNPTKTWIKPMKISTIQPISIAEAARLLAVSPRTVTRLVDKGDLSAIRIGATLALPVGELPALLQMCFDGDRPQALLTLHEVAARLGCAPDDVRARTARGELKSLRVGRSVRWLPLELQCCVSGEARP